MGFGDITIPLWQIVNIVTLCQCLVFAVAIVFFGARRGYPSSLLMALFIILAMTKADQLFQSLGGLAHYPQYGFVLTPPQALLTPLLYLFVTVRTTGGISLKRGHLLHLAPMFALFIYLFFIYYRLDLSAKITLIETRGLSNPVNSLLVPLIGDAVQVGYIAAAYRRLETFGVSLKNWFADLNNRNLRWMKSLLTIWGAVFILHAAVTILYYVFGWRISAGVASYALDIAHIVMVNILGLMALRDIDKVEHDQRLDLAPTAEAGRIYAGEALSPEQQAGLLSRASQFLDESRLHLQSDLTLGALADALGATPRELSQAINGAGGQSYFEFINRARISRAQQMLAESDARVLEICLACGFNSKSAFNAAFKKYVGKTPTDFRNDQNRAAPAEKNGQTAS